MGDKYKYVTYYVHLVGIKKKKLTARMDGVESLKNLTKSFI